MSETNEIAPELGQVRLHRHYGHELFPLKARSKEPLGPWREPDAAFRPEEHMASGGNLAVRLGAEDLVIDVDPRQFPDGRDVLAELCELIGVEIAGGIEFPVVQTGGGGYHVYMRKPAELRVVGNLRRQGFPGIDIKTLGGYVVAAGSVHPSGGLYLWDEDSPIVAPDVKDAPALLLELLERRELREAESTECPYAADDLISRLVQLDPVEYGKGRYDEWIELMMSLHAATGGDPEAMVAFEEWSAQDPEYADGGTGPSIEERWNGFRADQEGGVTWHTFARHVRGVPPSAEIVARDFPDDVELTEEELEAERSARDANRSRYKVDAPVLRDWVFVGDAMSFIRRTDFKQYRPEQWKAMFADLYPEGDITGQVYKGNTPVEKFEELVYVPSKPRAYGGKFNLWRPSAVEAVEGDTSILERHLELLLPDETERGHLLDYMRFLVCEPERKMMFAALIVGSQGTGKSAIGKLLERTVGASNVSQPSNAEVISNWTGWQEGASLAIIEELMMVGKLELANRLKPVITDGTLRIERKNQNHYSIPNHLNLLAFTNHTDAVRLEDGDRRWMVLSSPMEPQEDEYYDALFGWIHSAEAPGAFRFMLEKREPQLNPVGRAPMTDGKRTMREASKSDVELTLTQWLEERTGPFKHDLFRFDDAWSALRSSVGGRINKAGVTTALNRLGCVKHARYTNSGADLPTSSLWSCWDHERWDAAGAAERARAWQGEMYDPLDD